MATAESLLPKSEVETATKHPPIVFPFVFFHRRHTIADVNKLDTINRAADYMANGQVVIGNLVGVQGFIIDGSNENAVDRVIEIKGRRKEDTLVMAGSGYLRSKLIDRARLPQGASYPSTSNYDLPHFFEFPVVPEMINDGIGKVNEKFGRVAAVFWANYYLPLGALESALLARNPDGFVGGSSANHHNMPPVGNANESYQTFGATGQVSLVLYDKLLEKRGALSGSHDMLGYDIDGSVMPYRAGNIRLESFKPIYPSLRIPDGWEEKPTAIKVDLSDIRSKRSYLRD